MTAVYLRLVGDSGPVELLHGAVRTYAWGSRTAIAEFTGRPAPTAHPEAELWLGAHPGDPAWLETPSGKTSLLDAVAADPEGQLGSAVRERFGDTLPFLVKVLAAEEPLSLQAHPSPARRRRATTARIRLACRSIHRFATIGTEPQAGIAGFIG